jgi:hypothetical protein
VIVSDVFCRCCTLTGAALGSPPPSVGDIHRNVQARQLFHVVVAETLHATAERRIVHHTRYILLCIQGSHTGITADAARARYHARNERLQRLAAEHRAKLAEKRVKRGS